MVSCQMVSCQMVLGGNMKLHGIKINATLEAYLECMIWSEYDSNDDPLDKNYDFSHFSKELIEKSINELSSFEAEIHEKNLDDNLTSWQIGHDFWLTRNGHGCGFWDRGLGEQGDKLTAIVYRFGELYCYVGDDGQLYID